MPISWWCIMSFKHYFNIMHSRIQSLLSAKSKREKSFFIAALTLCIVFVMLDFVYMPLIEHNRALKALHTQTLEEFATSSNSLQNVKLLHLEQAQSMDSKRTMLEENLSILKEYMQSQEDYLNPFALMPKLIAFAKTQHLNLSTLTPYPMLDALNIEGMGYFDNLINLLEYIESHRFFSIDSLSLKPFNGREIYFNLLIIDNRLNPQRLNL